jgi:hypothetical protein
MNQSTEIVDQLIALAITGYQKLELFKAYIIASSDAYAWFIKNLPITSVLLLISLIGTIRFIAAIPSVLQHRRLGQGLEILSKQVDRGDDA